MQTTQSLKSPVLNAMQKLSMLETMGMEHKAMVAQLDDQFPPINPSPNDTLEQIMYRSGQRSVVEWLIHKFNVE